MRRAIVVGLLVIFLALRAADAAEVTRADLERLMDSTVHSWRFKLGESPGAESPDFDDSDWEQVEVGHKWWPHDSTCWYRARITIPEYVNGVRAAGSTVRLRVGMDNEAKAYVDGLLKQQFTWDDGDFVLTEHARPGETVTVALYGINRPGYGTLYQAYLVSSASEKMTDAVRQLFRDFDVALSYAHYVPPEEAEHWRDLIHQSMQELDLSAYRAAGEDTFLTSLERARAALSTDTDTFEDRLRQTGETLALLKERIQQGQSLGRQLAYQRVDARVVESFLQYARDDMTDGETSHQVRALRTARFLDRVCDQALEEAAAILEDPELDLAVPVYRTGPIAVRDGAFWQNDRPIFFTGVGHFGQVRKDTPLLPEYGLNIIQIEMGPNSVVTGPETVDETPIHDNILRALDKAAAHDVMVNLLISPHYFPQWAIERYPKLTECGHGFIRYCIDAPESREIHEKYLRALMPLIADHPALHSICLSNEPQYEGRCEYSRAMFHQWLKNRHKNISVLNGIYHTGLSKFDEVPLPADASNYALFYDFCRFNQDRFLEFHKFLAGLIHEYDPDLPVHAKVMSHAFSDPGKFEVGIDPEKFTLLGAIAGNDCVQTFEGELHTEYLQRWQDMALNYTFQRSVAPDKPIFNSEDHVIGDGDWRFIPGSHIRTAYWTQAIHGQGAATTWVWERGQEGDFSENILTRANCVRALGRVALDLNRLAPEVHALQRVKSDLAILYAFSSFLPSPEFAEEAAAAYEGAYFADTACDFVTERQAVAGGLNDYKVVVAPHASHVSASMVMAVQRYIASGGVVMMVGECFSFDEQDRPRKASLMEMGLGRLLIYPGRLTPRAYREILDGLLDEAGCDRPVRIAGKYGEPIWGVNLRTVEYGGKRLVNLVNFGRRDQTLVLEMNAPVKSVVNLFDNTEVILPIIARPLEPLLLAVETERATK